jgi:hypothetical protein
MRKGIIRSRKEGISMSKPSTALGRKESKLQAEAL